MPSSNNRAVTVSANTEVNGITFPKPTFPAAVNYGITVSANPVTLTLSGTGITNNSGQTQSFLADVSPAGPTAFIVFSNSATAGSSTVFTTQGGIHLGTVGASIEFHDTSTAGSGSFTNNGAEVSGGPGGGSVHFRASSTAANATFTNNAGPVNGASAGSPNSAIARPRVMPL